MGMLMMMVWGILEVLIKIVDVGFRVEIMEF